MLEVHKAEQLWWREKQKGIQIVQGGVHRERTRLSTVVDEHAGKEGKNLIAVRNSLQRCWELGSGGSGYSSQAPGGTADAGDACLRYLLTCSRASWLINLGGSMVFREAEPVVCIHVMKAFYKGVICHIVHCSSILTWCALQQVVL